MNRLYLALAAPLALSAAPPSSDPEVSKDLLCYMVLSGLAEDALAERNETLSNYAYAAAAYFLGRVDGRAPNLNLEQAMTAQADVIGDRPVSDFVPACIDRRRDRLRLITQIIQKKSGEKED